MSAAVAFAAGCDNRPVRTSLPTTDKHLSHDRGKKSLLERTEERGPDFDTAGDPFATDGATPLKGGLLDYGAPVLFGSGGNLKATPGADIGTLDPRLIDVPMVDVKYKAAFLRGEEFLKNGRFDQALASFDEAKRVDPKNYLAYLGESVGYIRKKDLGSALAAIDLAILYAPGKSELYSYRSQLRHQQGNVHGAIDDMTVVLKENPRDVAALSTRAGLRSKIGNYQAAIADMTAVLKEVPRDVAVLSTRAGFQTQIGNYPAAIADYTAALNERPGDVTCLFGRAAACFYSKRFQEAVTDATAVLAREPKLADAAFLRAISRLQLGEVEAGRADFDEAVRNGLNPRWAESWKPAFHSAKPRAAPK